MIDQPHVKILTPCYGGNITSGCFHSFMDFFPYAVQNGIPFSVETLPNCSLIPLGRDIMLRRAMNDPDWTHLLWIDADLRWKPQMVHSMILDDKDIVGGFYPKKGLPIDFASSPAPGGDDTEHLFETIYVATGFMLTKRHVIEKMLEHYADELTFSYQGGDDFVDLFGPIIDKNLNNLYLTEDYAFCYRARELGFKCYMSKRFEIPHLGQMEYSAEYEESFLKEYEKSGRITLNSDHKVNYFSALAPRKKSFAEDSQGFNQQQPEI
jgi:hypothetical protein